MSEIRPIALGLSVCLASTIVYGGAEQLGTRTPDAWIATLENPNRAAALKADEIVSTLRLGCAK